MPQCPRCGTKLEFWIEKELGNGNMRRITYYYKCPRCLYRLINATIVVKRCNVEEIPKLELPKVTKIVVEKVEEKLKLELPKTTIIVVEEQE